jgi:hypothetical protein
MADMVCVMSYVPRVKVLSPEWFGVSYTPFFASRRVMPMPSRYPIPAGEASVETDV